MKVRILVGANAYACIEDAGRSMDVRLSPGRSAPTSMRETAKEWRDKAAQLIERADLAERAAALLETRHGDQS